jgi:cytoskeletal protein CcmA (bactofilin family)
MGIFGKSQDPRSTESTRPAAPTPAPSVAPSIANPRALPSQSSTPAGSGAVCVIGSKTVLKGEITGDEDIQVEGRVEGEIRISKDLRIGTGGSVKASVHAAAVVVSGELTGDCTATSRVEIQATGRLFGNIRAPRVVIAEGATFRGMSDMSAR